ncbi:MAG: tetratricopeptide repeat protein [Verrucomicrobia bacterium]|nr:tetratricopeptide repeat protein [Verrucomicrobiota bacterium]
MPEKSVSEVARAWREQYEKGKAAYERNNLDYAISILTSVLEHEPAFYECREALRASQFRRAGTGGTTFFKKILGSTNPKLVQAQVLLRSKPIEALHAIEQILNGDPHNPAAHKALAEAALAADLPRTAVLSLEIVYKQSPKDRDVVLKLSEALTRLGDAARAEAVVAELARVYPKDPDIAQALKNVSASRTLSEGGYETLAEGEGSYRDILKNEQQAVTLEQEQRDYKSAEDAGRLIDEYEARLAKEPDNTRLMRSIAELCVQRQEFDRALSYYQRLLSGDTPDPTVERLITETKAKQLEHALTALDPDTPDFAERRERLKTEQQALLLEDCRRRAERYPNDLQVRFELGQLYYQAGRLSEAIQELQKAQHNPHKRIAALYHLGLCFSQRHMYDLAARTFQNAIKEKAVFDEEKKELIYALGCACEKLGKRDEAIEQFKQIYEVDIAYKDVEARVNAHYAAQATG